MSGEIQFQSQPTVNGGTFYMIVRNQAAQVWSVSAGAFVTFVDANWAQYAVTGFSESGTTSGFYVGNFPAGIVLEGIYNVTVYLQGGGSPSESDGMAAEGTFYWNGSAEATATFGPYLITTAYAKQFLNVTTSTYDVQISAFVAAASTAVQRYCNRQFINQEYVETYDVNINFDRTLSLNQWPVTSVVSVTTDPYSTQPTVINGSQFIISASGVIKLKPSETTYCDVFPTGFQKVTVDYFGGYVSVPDDVQLATAMVTANHYYMMGMDTQYTSKKLGDYQYNKKLMVALTDDIKRMLDPYRRICI